MRMQPEYDIVSIGTGLVEASQARDPSASELLSELFPYVYEASRRMSTRGIRDWLKENHGIQISQPTLSRALRNSEKYRQAFAEFIEPWARRVEEAIEPSMQDFLFDDRVFKHFVDELPPASSFPPDSDEAAQFAEVEDAIEFLENRWFSLSEETRQQYRRYFVQMDEPEAATGEEA
jgi:hypothetical protein